MHHSASLDRLVDVLDRLDRRLAELDLERLALILERLESRLPAQEERDPNIIGVEEACKLLGCTRGTLDHHRKFTWIEGVHWWKPGRKIQFDRVLLEDWQRNGHDAFLHRAAIERRQKELQERQRRA